MMEDRKDKYMKLVNQYNRVYAALKNIKAYHMLDKHRILESLQFKMYNAMVEQAINHISFVAVILIVKILSGTTITTVDSYIFFSVCLLDMASFIISVNSIKRTNKFYSELLSEFIEMAETSVDISKQTIEKALDDIIELSDTLDN